MTYTAWWGYENDWELSEPGLLNNIFLPSKSSYWFDFVTITYPDNNDGSIGYGLYELHLGSNMIYLDFRDTDYAYEPACPGWIYGCYYWSGEIKIRWNASTSRFEHQRYDTANWETVQPNATIGIWDTGRKESGYPT